MAKKILWVEDERYQVDAYMRSLKRRGYEIDFFETPWEVLEYVEEERNRDFSLIIIDLMLPVGEFSKEETQNGLATGVILLLALRRWMANLPCIYFTNIPMSTIAGENVYRLATHVDKTVWLQKGISSDELIGVVRKLIGEGGES
ncbi:hypothetical protein CEE36_11015 [candidate division TA06 bacterium B3_TA06]|uniref:Response regulatory domain-containing protein n=1 Tax=candidate division TA06 bacterium B3_TA06 TaxID=2012487 RepID=A0A532US63_UNCT6|nr:MAG: hypothetical protein CEE36_11015 [candidate division TA06 bacterium B3_TA06]